MVNCDHIEIFEKSYLILICRTLCIINWVFALWIVECDVIVPLGLIMLQISQMFKQKKKISQGGIPTLKSVLFNQQPNNWYCAARIFQYECMMVPIRWMVWITNHGPPLHTLKAYVSFFLMQFSIYWWTQKMNARVHTFWVWRRGGSHQIHLWFCCLTLLGVFLELM